MLLKLLSSSPALRRCFVVSLTPPGEVADRIRALGVSVHTLGMRSALHLPSAIVGLCRLLRAEHATIVSTWMYHADLVGGISGWLLRLPVVWGIRNSDLSPSTSKLTTRGIVRLLGLLSGWLPKRIISCSRRAVDIHVALGYQRRAFEVIPNGFALDTFKPSPTARRDVRAELSLPSGALLVGSVARFDPQKNHLGLLRAAAAVQQKCPGVHFVLVGEGVVPTNSQLSVELKKLGISDCVHMLGKRDDVARILAALDVFVSSSDYGEGFPNVIGEAMACGVPCAVTDVGDSAFVVGSAGVIVRPGDSGAIADGILQLLQLTDDQRAVAGALGRSRIKENFELHMIAKRYESLFALLDRTNHTSVVT